jgi:hypothetical protein
MPRMLRLAPNRCALPQPGSVLCGYKAAVLVIATRPVAEQMIACGVRAKVTCVDPKKLDQCFAGREFDLRFLADPRSSTVVKRRNRAY